MDLDAVAVLRAAYRAFNERDLEAAAALLHPDVDWPNAWEGGRVTGRGAVLDYWRRQFESISSTVTPEEFRRADDGGVTVRVHQLVDDAVTGERQAESHVTHRWTFRDGLVARMDVGPADG